MCVCRRMRRWHSTDHLQREPLPTWEARNHRLPPRNCRLQPLCRGPKHLPDAEGLAHVS
jgi:hypothetical protein